MPVLPVPLVATVFLRSRGAALSELELKAAVAGADRAARGGRRARLRAARATATTRVDVGLRMLTLRHLVEEQRRACSGANPDELPLLRYYANSIAHLLPRLARRGTKTKRGPKAPF